MRTASPRRAPGIKEAAALAAAALSLRLAGAASEPRSAAPDLLGPVQRISAGIDPALANPSLDEPSRWALKAERERLLDILADAGRRGAGDTRVQMEAGRALLGLGEPARARPFLENAARLARAAGDTRGAARADVAAGTAAERLGDYAGAVALARKALSADPRSREALGLLYTNRGRSAPAPAPAAPPARTRAGERTPRLNAGPAFAAARPAADAPDRDDLRAGERRLLAFLLRRSDANPVARAVLSPLLRSGRVAIRLERPKSPEDPLADSWGLHDSAAGVVRCNLDEINREIAEYDEHHARRPDRQVAPIDERRPLDARQAEFLAGRFLPLAVHEIGGHAADGEALRRLSGRSSAPANLDTEVLAWRLEAAAVHAERAADPGYLTEPTRWAAGESRLVRLWRQGREGGRPDAVEKYLQDMGYSRRFDALRNNYRAARQAVARSLALVQSRCRALYDEACRQAASLLMGAVNLDDYPRFKRRALAFQAAPADPAARAAFLNELHSISVLDNQLDAKGLRAAAAYFQRREREILALEHRVHPVDSTAVLRALGNR